MNGNRMVGLGLIALGGGLAADALLGPLALKVIKFHISPAMENQVVGGDVASLMIAAPAAVAAGILWMRGHRLAPALAVPPALYAIYYAVSLVLGEQYDRYPGNNERFFPLYLGLTVLGGVIVARAWPVLRPLEAPEPGAGMRRTTAGVLMAVGALLGLAWARAIWGVATGTALTPEYLADPNVFWTIKLLDTTLVIPLALATGGGLLRRRPLASTAACGITGYLACQGAAVAGMAVVMVLRNDPSASMPFLVLSSLGTLALIALTAQWARLYGHGAGHTPLSLRLAPRPA